MISSSISSLCLPDSSTVNSFVAGLGKQLIALALAPKQCTWTGLQLALFHKWWSFIESFNKDLPPVPFAVIKFQIRPVKSVLLNSGIIMLTYFSWFRNFVKLFGSSWGCAQTYISETAGCEIQKGDLFVVVKDEDLADPIKQSAIQK